MKFKRQPVALRNFAWKHCPQRLVGSESINITQQCPPQPPAHTGLFCSVIFLSKKNKRIAITQGSGKVFKTFRGMDGSRTPTMLTVIVLRGERETSAEREILSKKYRKKTLEIAQFHGGFKIKHVFPNLA